ncbi:MAG: cation-efflux pump, partial [Betaproteobacteria bacterium]|nr:cation-efflux pump [Betaproteobacteria bacterium]
MSSLSQRASRGRAVLLAGVLINLILAVVKMSAGWIGHSDALVADGLESTLDVLSSSFIWLAL